MSNGQKLVTAGFGDALRTLTALPWPGRRGGDLGASLPWFPLVGLLLGGLLYGAALLLNRFPFPSWPKGVAALLLVLEIALTRGLHLDGLADWADSVGAFNDRERRLAIMKDHAVGAFGVIALSLDLLFKWAAFERLLSCGATVWLILIFALSRGFMVELMTTLPSARGGRGVAGPFVTGASERHRFITLFEGLAVSLAFGPLGLVFFMISWLLVGLFRARCRGQFGGITGDLLGTANEMVVLALLLVTALPGHRILAFTGWLWILK